MADNKREQPGLEPSLRKKVVQTAFISAAYFTFGVLRGQDGVTFLDLISITNSDIGSGSLMFTVSALGYVLGTVVIGVLFDKFNNDILYCACLLLTGVTTVLIPWCKYLPLMIAIFGLRSFFAGPADSGSSVICARVWLLQAGPFLHNLQFLFAVGGIISPFITEPFLSKAMEYNLTNGAFRSLYGNNVSEISPYNDSVAIRSNSNYLKKVDFNKSDSSFVYFNQTSQDLVVSLAEDRFPKNGASQVYIAFAIAGGILLLFCLGFGIKILLYSSGEFDRFGKAFQSAKAQKRPNPVATFSRQQKITCYVLLGGFCFSSGCVEKILMSFLMTFTVEHLGWSKTDGSLATTVFWSGFAAGRFLGIFLVKIFRPSTLLFVNLVGLLITCGAMTFVGHLSGDGDIWWGLIAASGLFLSTVFATSISWLDQSLTPVTGKLVTFIYIWLFVGAMTHLYLLGYLFEELTPLWFVDLLFIHTIFNLLTAIALFVVSRRFRHAHSSAVELIASSKDPHLEHCQKSELHQSDKEEENAESDLFFPKHSGYAEDVH